MRDWPWRRFDAFYRAYQRRKLVEMLERRKELIVAAFWSNPNFDEEKGSRTKAVDEMESNFRRAVRIIYSKKVPKDTRDEVDLHNDPFFAPAMRGTKDIKKPVKEDATVQEAIKEEFEGLDVDQ